MSTRVWKLVSGSTVCIFCCEDPSQADLLARSSIATHHILRNAVLGMGRHAALLPEGVVMIGGVGSP